jgi:hypothetical protein
MAGNAIAGLFNSHAKTEIQRMFTTYFVGYKWWHLPAMAALSAVSITLVVYLISISQFGADMAFMFNNLI